LKLQVVAPCNEDWDRMPGGDDIRFCGKCRQNVYNLSALTESQARELVPGHVCVRFFHRGDGTVITKKCPPMMEAARRRLVALAAGGLALLPLAAGFWGSVAWLRGWCTGARARWGPPSPRVRPWVSRAGEEEPPRVMMGAPPPPPRLMGKIALPPRTLGQTKLPTRRAFPDLVLTPAPQGAGREWSLV
jgi:hypothetical protein